MLTQDTGQLTERSRLLKPRAPSSTRQSARVRTAPLNYTGFCLRTLITPRAFNQVRDVISKAGVLVPLAVDGILLNESIVNLSADAQLTGRLQQIAGDCWRIDGTFSLLRPVPDCGKSARYLNALKYPTPNMSHQARTRPQITEVLNYFRMSFI